ncbi:hypothetical protein GW940_00580 [Candidatus Microgenomates bacterium]|nr:hypothetical protein [Candidatus Microgenomates bacterium]
MIIVTGTVGFDHIMDYDGLFANHINPANIHKLNISFNIEEVTKQIGGTAANQAYSLGLLGTYPYLVTTAGDDFDQINAYLKAVGVDTSSVLQIPGKPCCVGFVMTDKSDNQIWGYAAGAGNATKNLSFVKLAKKVISKQKPKKPFVIIAPQNYQAMLNWAKECRELNLAYAFDPAFYIPQMGKAQLKQAILGAELLFGNDYEIDLIKSKLKLKKLQFKNPNLKATIKTVGPEGSVIIDNKTGKEFKIKAAKVQQVIDPTGAGDAYRSGFITGYLNGQSLKVCGQMGAVAAAYAIEHLGTINHKFTIPQFNKRYKQNYNSTGGTDPAE